jgi:hypothetical protein
MIRNRFGDTRRGYRSPGRSSILWDPKKKKFLLTDFFMGVPKRYPAYVFYTPGDQDDVYEMDLSSMAGKVYGGAGRYGSCTELCVLGRLK